MEKKDLDYILVPSGLLVMVAYHMWLLHRIVKHPNNTVIGINTVTRRYWVRAMMEVILLLYHIRNLFLIFLLHIFIYRVSKFIYIYISVCYNIRNDN